MLLILLVQLTIQRNFGNNINITDRSCLQIGWPATMNLCTYESSVK
jgi:hypothetical protein